MAYRGTKGGDYGNGGWSSMQQQNDDMTDQLAHRVGALKGISIAIGNDIREQNRLINEMESDFDRAGGFLGSTMQHLKRVARTGGKNLILYVLLFSLFVLIVIYWLIRR
ncbi:hypothetical protein L596_024778 [Steinernema carpocapsae]|uniref:t-SNARE coiled-coil homology domain-containing protein n=1 Tax=Steinernema carpocapsae TaxID=34508 RepID=A0A4U5M5T4_STECR|nr:hypothetical protein L596_024778 [Steinernema carpocapsae]